MNAKDTQQIVEAITSGKYRSAYLVYARKSTDEPDSQKNSIAHQKAEGVRYCQAQGLAIAPVTLSAFCTNGVISERHSAFKENLGMEFGEDGSVRYRVERPKFHRLASFLDAGYFKGVVFLCWDRASRNKGDELILRRLMKPGVDVRFVLATYDDTSAGELHKDIDGMFSEHHSRVTREKVTATMRRSRDNGLCTHKAPVGYLNNGSMEWKPLDPERAPVIRQLFEKADRTDWSLSDLRRWSIGQGFTMPPMRRKRTAEERLEDEERDERRDLEKSCRPPTVTQMHVILTNPFYTGKVRGNHGLWVPSCSHEPLVSQALFDRVQKRLHRRRTSIHYEKKLDLPFRGFVRCGCGRVYTPYLQKGIVYFGARCDRTCPNPLKSVNLEFVFGAAKRVLSDLMFTPEQRASLDAGVSAVVAGLEERQSSGEDARQRQHRTLEDDLAYLADNRLTLLRTGAYSPEGLTAEEARLRTEIAGTELASSVTTEDHKRTLLDVLSVSELLNMACLQYEMLTQDVRVTLACSVVSELVLSENTLSFKARNGFHMLEGRDFSESALTDWLSEGITRRDDLRFLCKQLNFALEELSQRP